MPGLEKTSGKSSYGAPGQHATKGNTKKRVRGQNKKRSRRKGKEQTQRSEIAVKLNNQIKSEIFNLVASTHINEALSMNESPKHRTMKISRREWKKTPLSYRSFIKGKPYMLQMGKSGATELVPVEIVKGG